MSVIHTYGLRSNVMVRCACGHVIIIMGLKETKEMVIDAIDHELKSMKPGERSRL